MSSYIESTFVIESRRLQKIVSQCEEELKNALSKLNVKRQEKAQERNTFQTNIAIGSLIQGDNRNKEDIEKNIMVNKIMAKYDFLQKMYRDVIDESIKRKMNEIMLLATKGDVSEELLMSMLNGCEQQLTHSALVENTIKDKYKEAHQVPSLFIGVQEERKRGVKIQLKKQSTLEADRFEADDFEQKLKVLKSINRYKREQEILQIEKEYIAQPDFAKELYARQNIAKLDQYLQDELRKREEKVQSTAYREDLKKQYEALKDLIGSKNDQSIPSVESLENLSVKSIENFCEKLQSKLIEIRKKEYVANAVRTVMQRHGIACCSIMDNVTFSQNYQYDENIDFNISGISQNRFISEINGKFYGKTPTLDERRKSVGSAKKACTFLRAIREELEKEFGIIFDETEIMEPSEKSIVMRNVGGNHFEQKAYYSEREHELVLEE